MSTEVGHRKEGRWPSSCMVPPMAPQKVLEQIQISVSTASLSVKKILAPTNHLLPLKASKVKEK